MMQIIADYFERLAAAHKKINHSKEHIHFAYLEDQKQSLLADTMEFPFLEFSHGGYTIVGSPVNWSKRYQCQLTLTAHAEDSGDSALIERIISEMEGIMDDILGQMLSDKRQGKMKYLRGVNITNATVTPVQNVDATLYGCTVAIAIDVPWCPTPSEDAFDTDKL